MKPLIMPFEGNTPEIDDSAFIAPNATVIGNVTIAEGASIWFNVVLRGDKAAIRIGKDTNIQDGTVIHVGNPHESLPEGNPSIIGDNVTVGHMALIHGCRIHDKALIGMKACVMDGAVIEEGAIVGAGSVVPPNKVIPKYQLWMGSPARFVRELSPDEIDHVKWMNDVYIELTPKFKKTI